MRTITKTTLLELMTAIAEGIVPFTFVFLVRKFFDFADLLVADGSSVFSVGQMFFSILPSLMMLSVPMAILLSTMMVYGRMSTDRELTALHAAGYTTKQLLVPILILGICTTLLMLWWGNRIAPKGLRLFQTTAVEVLEKTATAGIKPGVFNRLGNFVFYPNEVIQGRMHSLRIFEHENRQVSGVISAPTGSLTFVPEKRVVKLYLEDGVLHQSPRPDRDSVIQFHTMSVSMGISTIIDKMARPGRWEQQFSRSRLNDLISDYKHAAGTEPDKNMAKWYKKQWKRCEIEKNLRISQPFACIIMAFVGALLGMSARAGKRSSCYTMTVVTIFIYYILLNFGKSYAEDGTIPALFAGWIPNLVAALVGVWMYRRLLKL